MMTNEAEAYHYNSEKLPQKSTNNDCISAMLEVYKSVLDTNGVFYCSAPITSGKRYLDWLKRIEKQFVDIDSADKSYHELHFKEVINPNRKHAQKVIERLRQQTGNIVVDPTALPCISGWTQQDWRSFWQQVIERYATTAFFVNDWQYSNGCVYEFYVAQKKGIPTFNEEQQPLNLAIGIDMITEAILSVQQRGGSTSFVEEVLKEMKDLLVELEDSNGQKTQVLMQINSSQT